MPRLFAFILKCAILLDIIVLTIYESQIKKWFAVRIDIASFEPPIHSVWLWDPLGTPHYSLLHR
jgi:hypothetical protein